MHIPIPFTLHYITLTYALYCIISYDLILSPVHLLRLSLLRVLESNFPGDPISNSTDMRIPTPEN